MAIGNQNEVQVDALDDGKIVRVSEAYAKREGLLILRRFSVAEQQNKMAAMARDQKLQQVKESPFESLRRPLRTNNNALASLVHNFHWQIHEARRQRNMTRKQLAQALSVSEHEVKLLEHGLLPSDDFILISKVEKYFGLHLRRDSNASAPAAHLLRKASSSNERSETVVESEENGEALLGKDDLLVDDVFEDERR